MKCEQCNYYFYDECEGCETCHYEQDSLDRMRKNLDRLRKKRKQVEEEDGVKLWFAELPYDEPDHLAWLEELDIEREEK